MFLVTEAVVVVDTVAIEWVVVEAMATTHSMVLAMVRCHISNLCIRCHHVVVLVVSLLTLYKRSDHELSLGCAQAGNTCCNGSGRLTASLRKASLKRQIK